MGLDPVILLLTTVVDLTLPPDMKVLLILVPNSHRGFLMRSMARQDNTQMTLFFLVIMK